MARDDEVVINAQPATYEAMALIWCPMCQATGWHYDRCSGLVVHCVCVLRSRCHANAGRRILASLADADCKVCGGCGVMRNLDGHAIPCQCVDAAQRPDTDDWDGWRDGADLAQSVKAQSYHA